MSFPIVYYNVQWSIGITPGVSFHICDYWSFFFSPWSWVTNCLRVIHHEEEREELGTGWANLVLCSTRRDGAVSSRIQGFSTWTRPKLLLSSSFALRIPLYDSSTFWYPSSLGYIPHIPTEKEALLDCSSHSVFVDSRKGQVLMFLLLGVRWGCGWWTVRNREGGTLKLCRGMWAKITIFDFRGLLFSHRVWNKASCGNNYFFF